MEFAAKGLASEKGRVLLPCMDLQDKVFPWPLAGKEAIQGWVREKGQRRQQASSKDFQIKKHGLSSVHRLLLKGGSGSQ